MNKSEKIKAELSNFWLKQLDQSRTNALHGTNDKPSQKVSPSMADLSSRRQFQRVSGYARGKQEKNNSAGTPGIAGSKKRLGGNSSTVAKLESSRDAGPADPLHKWLDPNAIAGQCEGRFYIEAVDVLSLKQAQGDWNYPAGNLSEPAHSHPDWILIDDRLMWLSAPSS